MRQMRILVLIYPILFCLDIWAVAKDTRNRVTDNQPFGTVSIAGDTPVGGHAAASETAAFSCDGFVVEKGDLAREELVRYGRREQRGDDEGDGVECLHDIFTSIRESHL